MRLRTAISTLLVVAPVLAMAQSRPPVAQFWADVATHNHSVPGMGEMGMPGGGFFGATKMGGWNS